MRSAVVILDTACLRNRQVQDSPLLTAPPTAIDLVIGADGLIGGALFHHLHATGTPIVGTTRRAVLPSHLLPLDLGLIGPSWCPPPGVRVAYLAAAVAQLAQCEADPIGTAAVNIEGALTAARALIASGAFVVFLSTNQVYDGELPMVPADTPTRPVNMYGKQKARAEKALLDLGPTVAVVRLTKVVARSHGIFRTWQEGLDRGEAIEPFTDMVLAPVSLGFTINALIAIGQRQHGGIWQISGPVDVSYAEAACHLIRCRGLPMERIRPTTARARGLPMHLTPKHTTLDTRRLVDELGLVPPAPVAIFDELFCQTPPA